MSRALALTSRLKLPPNYYDYVGYAAMHLACLGVFWVGISWQAAILCLASYFVRIFGLMAGFHRYFSHHSYKTSRPMQLAMAILGSLAVQKGVLWWAEHHRHHHRFPDEPEDVHSPVTGSFLYSHSGWFLDQKNRGTDLSKVPDLAAFPELVWLNRWDMVPVGIYALLLFAVFGWTGLIWGFFVSTVLIWHAMHSIGSFAHKWGGYRRYPTTDNSRNQWFLALVTLGEGWHNNHHYYPASARQGFFWYEIDVAYCILKVMSWFGLVWDLKSPPEYVKRGELPGYERRLQIFKTTLIDFRRRLVAAIDRAIRSDEMTADLRAQVAELERWVAERIDTFEEAVYTLLIQGPLAMSDAYLVMRDEVLAKGGELKAHLGDRTVDELCRRLRSEFDRFQSRPEFPGKIAA
jgi:stearoyl-CoA desaturase (delta-9 desaturase)